MYVCRPSLRLTDSLTFSLSFVKPNDEIVHVHLIFKNIMFAGTSDRLSFEHRNLVRIEVCSPSYLSIQK